MTFDLSSLSPLYFTGRRVRLTPKGAAKLLVPVTLLYGLILKLIALPGSEPKVLVEFETIAGDILTGLYALKDVETLPVMDTQLVQDLVGRAVHFPRSSGIGIAFPEHATDDAVITRASWEGGKVRLVVWVRMEGPHPDAPFVTPADFSQCDLRLRPSKRDTG